MKYRELIKKVQLKSGFSDAESKDALDATVEALAVRLNDGERKDFASQLPEELQDIALSVTATEENTRKDLLQHLVDTQSIAKDRAKKQLLSAWAALKDAISPGEINDIRSQLPKKAVTMLH